jgi:hypothetical protein
MKADYKAVLCAVQKRDKALWDLGDALVATVGTPLNKSYIASIPKQWKQHQREEAKE